jgi:hypothetical protein
MRVHIPCAALGLTLVAAASAAAQTSPVIIAPAAPMATAPALYDIDPGPVDAPAGVVAPAVGPAAPVPAYQYIYQPDRILVVDPVTGIAMQALPR